jgi:Ser/Thr protein kinase RdoA (MazF antagonist)
MTSPEAGPSQRSQVARIRRLAERALAAYPLAGPRLRFIAHGENTTFRVDAGTASGPDRFLLRVHRPGRHGRRADPVAAVESELRWLTALRAEAGLPVPEPVRTADGNLTTLASATGVPEPRVCSVLRWMDGRRHTAAPRPVHLRRLGSVMARLHNHSERWIPPPGFVRIRWDWETFFGDTMIYGGISAGDVWDLLPGPLRRDFDRVASRMKRVMGELGDGPAQSGLIHADLHLDNALFCRDEVRVIDFDDCGSGYRLYDIAVALWELRHRDDYPLFRDALLQGYAAHRPLPDGLAHLDDFIATRDVAFGLWFTGTAQASPAFRADLTGVQQSISRSLKVLLPR